MISFFELFLFILPAYVANVVPVLLGGGAQLDLQKTWFDGRELFGRGKTIRGFISGVAAGTFFGGIVSLYYHLPFFASQDNQFFASFLLAFGTMTGDAMGSFVKRRMNVESGKPFFLDTISFLLVALLFAYPFTSAEAYSAIALIFLVFLTLILHPLSNIIANRLGLKSVPW